ncbi:MAG: HAD family phosphatase [Candidatus Aenigmatarchaeota archaeon]
MSLSIMGILYDFDGTIVKSDKFIRETYYEICKEMGIKPSLSYRMLQRLHYDWKKFLRRQKIDPEKAEEAYKNKTDKIKVIPEVKKVLKYNKKHGKIQGIVTHSPRSAVEEIARKNKIEEYIDGMITWDEIEERNLRPKPEPDALVCLARDLNLETKKCLYVGNSKEDIIAGKRAGMLTLGFCCERDLRVIARLRAANPYFGVITSPQHLYIYFQRLIF